ncbi:MAG TPA: hypothetical protein VK249_27895 [Anaerolineales bacterium]|nr:hypothetical protein [Anaerolineales bacterium]
MKRFQMILPAVMALIMVVVSACAPAATPVAPAEAAVTQVAEATSAPATEATADETEATAASATEAASVPATEAASDQAAEPQFQDFDPKNFTNPTVIDNQWAPMKPGTYWAYEGTALDEGNTVDRRIEFSVTDLTKEIEGVRTVAAWIEDYNNGELAEKEIAFYAQDNDGNVWYFGEHPEDYVDGEFVDAPTWIAGIADAKPGIKMQPDPQLGAPSLFQGWGPGVDWSDYGQVDQVGQKTCVPVDCYQDVLVIAESSLAEAGAYQLKYYARGVGNIQVGWKGTDETHEELKMVEYKQLSPDELADIHKQALELEQHAYEVNKDIYGETTPMQ